MSDEYERALHMPPRSAQLTQRDVKRHYIVGDRRKFINDTLVPGFALMLTPKGHKSLVFRYRFQGKTDKITFDTTSVEEARKLAAGLRGTLAMGDNPKYRAPGSSAKSKMLREVVRDYLALHQFKSSGEFARSLEKHVLPTLGDKPYESFTRQDLAKLRDDTTQQAGRHASHYALNCLGAVWNKYYCDHASDGFTWPKVRSPLTDEDRKSKGRMLSDREIRAVWQATFRLRPNKGAYFRFLLLTGARRTSAARITRAQIADDWSKVAMPSGGKTKPAYDLMLSAAARDLLRDYFPEGGTWAFEHLGPYAPQKAELNIQVGQIAPFRNHDLRHTARSLLSRAGVSSDTAKLCVGHALKGMDKTYDHHPYEAEKLAAMEKLADLITEIVKGNTAAK